MRSPFNESTVLDQSEPDSTTRQRCAETVRHVTRKIPFYQSYQCPEHPPRLEDLPVMDSAGMAEHFDALYCLDSYPDFVATTGGTSGETKSCILRSYEEMDAAFKEQFALHDDQRLDADQFIGFTLNLVDHQHGLTLPPRHGQPVFTLPLEAGRHFHLIERMLRKGLVVKGKRRYVNQLIGSSAKLRALTAYCQAMDDIGLDYHIHRIVTTAFRCSIPWRERMESYWGAAVIPSYGLSEFPEANAMACKVCGFYHMPATVFSEILQLDRDEPAAGTPGRLILTSLYPYRKLMPFIRYDTGDLVMPRDPNECPHSRPGQPAFEFLGRRSMVLLDKKCTQTWITAFDVLDVLEEILGRHLVRNSELAQVMGFGMGDIEPDFSEIGYPRISLHADTARGTMQLRGESTSPDHITLAEKTRAALQQIALKRDPMASPEVDVQFFQRGAFESQGLRTTLI